jgi:site-specific DNA-methyltransferase (adenine-specific)
LNTLQSLVNRVIEGDCLDIMKTMPAECVDMVLTDPPYLANYVPRDGRSIAGDDDRRWLRPAFTELFRILKPDRFCVSFYGWSQAERFLWTWKRIGFVPVGHLVFVKDYPSKTGFTRGHHEVAYVLAKGEPKRPIEPLRDVIQWTYSGNALHPNQKPLSVLTPLVVSFSEPGDIVFDPFAGSGTTGIAARQCGRRFILIEKLKGYYQAARDRINEAR